MATLILTDLPQDRLNLLPFSYTQPNSEIRIGITTITEKWNNSFKCNIAFLTENYLQNKYAFNIDSNYIYVNSTVIPNNELINTIQNLPDNTCLFYNDIFIACKTTQQLSYERINEDLDKFEKLTFKFELLKINYIYDIFKYNGKVLNYDFEQITKNRTSNPLSRTNTILGNNIFVEEGVKAECATINTLNGPVYIGKNAEIMEGSIIRGPFALCNNATTKLATKIYGPTTIGPHCKVGGEINNSVFFGYANKAHDGFLGNSVIAKWCNIGADSNNSNLKNNYANVKLWNYTGKHFKDTGLQFCGLFMGEHSKCGINTMFNTGTVVGVSANIFGAGFPRNLVPSFSWGGSHGFIDYKLNKALQVAEIVMKRRNIPLTETDINILEHVYNISKEYRECY